MWKLIISLSSYLPGVRPPPQNSAEAKKLGGGAGARKKPDCEELNNQWGMTNPHDLKFHFM
ncbi:hypothetical protein CW304_18460 [Bacillus sp. UFRGS-B20]|nr:hypothetical protein CW304_18460 [Bacillus sp. UFRGS-B20]